MREFTYDIDSFMELSITEIKQLCKDYKIKNYNSLTVNETIDKLNTSIYNEEGYYRTKHCNLCGGTGILIPDEKFPDCVNACDDCMCGGCGSEKYYCNGC